MLDFSISFTKSFSLWSGRPFKGICYTFSHKWECIKGLRGMQVKRICLRSIVLWYRSLISFTLLGFSYISSQFKKQKTGKIWKKEEKKEINVEFLYLENINQPHEMICVRLLVFFGSRTSWVNHLLVKFDRVQACGQTSDNLAFWHESILKQTRSVALWQADHSPRVLQLILVPGSCSYRTKRALPHGSWNFHHLGGVVVE